MDTRRDELKTGLVEVLAAYGTISLSDAKASIDALTNHVEILLRKAKLQGQLNEISHTFVGSDMKVVYLEAGKDHVYKTDRKATLQKQLEEMN